MCMSNENVICSLNLRINCRHIRRGNVTPSIRPARVPSHRVASRWRRSVDSRQIWIDQNTGRSISDLPARCPQVFQSDWVVFFRVRLVLSSLSYEDSHREYTARESRLYHWNAPPGRPCRGVYFEQSKPIVPNFGECVTGRQHTLQTQLSHGKEWRVPARTEISGASRLGPRTQVARLGRLERPTLCSGGTRSIQL